MARGNVAFATSNRHGKALYARLSDGNVHKSWKDYVASLRADDPARTGLVDLRRQVVDHIKYQIGCQVGRRIRGDALWGTSAESDKGTEDGLSYVSIPSLVALKTATDSATDSDSVPYCDMMRPFIMDSGSVNDDSDADLTIINPPDLEIVDRLVTSVKMRFRAVDEMLKKGKGKGKGGLTRDSLKEVFDVSFYLNSFVVNVDGLLSYVKCDTDGSRSSQRLHATRRLRNEFPDLFDHDVDIAGKIITDEHDVERQRNTFDGIDKGVSSMRTSSPDSSTSAACQVLELMSRTTYFVGDAYHSQGGFLHVLVEIQTGTPLDLTASQYMDSAFENLGMLVATTTASPRSLSKYLNRTVHALGRFVNRMGGQNENALAEIVGKLDEATDVNTDHTTMSCSIGHMSSSITAANIGDAAKFANVFRSGVGDTSKSSKKKTGVFLPQRKAREGVESAQLVRSALEGLLMLQT